MSGGFVSLLEEGNGNDGSSADADDTNNSNNNIIDVGKYEKEGSLIIMDSAKGYFDSE